MLLVFLLDYSLSLYIYIYIISILAVYYIIYRDIICKRNDNTLAKYVWDLKLKHNVKPTMKWHILKSVAPYSNITKKCRLCLREKFEILSYPNPDELLNKRSEPVSKCRHVNKFLFANYKGND